MEVFRRHGVGWSSHWFLWAVYKNLSCEVKVGEVLSDSFVVVATWSEAGMHPFTFACMLTLWWRS